MTDATPLTEPALLANIQAIAPIIRAEAAKFDLERRLTDAAHEALKSTGVYRMPIPQSWGGPELDPLAQTRVIEAISAIDGSAGWCAMIGSDGGYLTSFLDDAVGRQMYPDLDTSSVFVIAPTGAAMPVDGGYRVTGRWPFASGSAHASWFAFGCIVPEATGPRMLKPNLPEVRVCVFPRDQVQIHDTWFTTGVRGSGSNDVSVDGVFVPTERTFSVIDAPIRRPGPLYAWRFMFIVNMLGVPLGIAQSALDEVIEIGPKKLSMRRTPVTEEAWFTAALGEASALILSARAFGYASLANLWESLQHGAEPTARVRAEQRLALVHAFDACTRAVDILYRIAGSSALYTQKSGLDKKLRDLYATRQHVLANPVTYSAAGRVLVGLDPGVTAF